MLLGWLPHKRAYKIQWALRRCAGAGKQRVTWHAVALIISCLPEETIKQMTINRVDETERDEL